MYKLSRGPVLILYLLFDLTINVRIGFELEAVYAVHLHVKMSLVFGEDMCIIYLSINQINVAVLFGYGSILLLPTLMREGNNVTEQAAGSLSSCGTIVQGSQFLILAMINGGANVLGRLAGVFFHGRVRFAEFYSRLLQRGLHSALEHFSFLPVSSEFPSPWGLPCSCGP